MKQKNKRKKKDLNLPRVPLPRQVEKVHGDKKKDQRTPRKDKYNIPEFMLDLFV